MLVQSQRMLGGWRVLLAGTLALSVLNCGDHEGRATDDLLLSDEGEATSASVGLDLTGNWGMFLFEDPVAIRLSQEGDVLTGVGCCIPDLAADQYCCGAIEGSVDGDHAAFSFPLGDLGGRYRAEVTVSGDGMRLGGEFQREDATDTPITSVKTAWLRYGFEQETWLTTYPELESELRDLSGVVLRLSDESEAGDGFEHGEDYRLFAAFGSIGGDLGPFWGSELKVRESDGAIVAGPVPATDPGLPETMVLHRDGKVLLDAEVSMASGTTYRFSVVSQDHP